MEGLKNYAKNTAETAEVCLKMDSSDTLVTVTMFVAESFICNVFFIILGISLCFTQFISHGILITAFGIFFQSIGTFVCRRFFFKFEQHWVDVDKMTDIPTLSWKGVHEISKQLLEKDPHGMKLDVSTFAVYSTICNVVFIILGISMYFTGIISHGILLIAFGTYFQGIVTTFYRRFMSKYENN